MMTDHEIAERCYRSMRDHAGSDKKAMGDVIDAMLSFKTKDKLFQNVVIIMAMIYANEEGH
jgi:hypothetical protein